MYRIAVCDDEKRELDKSERMLAAYEKERSGRVLAVRRFESIKAFLDAVRDRDYAPDLVLMDIYMPGKTGIAAVRELRAMGKQTAVVFLTSSEEHALEAFRLDASQYLVKPVTEEELFPVLDRFLAEREDGRQRYVLFRIDGRIQRVAVGDIVSCEAQGKRQCLCLADGARATLHTTMLELYGVLSQYEEFVKVGAAYIVNMEHIDSLNARDVCMDDGSSIYLPRGAYQPLRQRYFEYYCGGRSGCQVE